MTVAGYLMHLLVEITVQNGFWKLENKKELIVNLRHIMDFGDNEFEIKILNKNQIVHNMEEFIDIAVEYV